MAIYVERGTSTGIGTTATITPDRTVEFGRAFVLIHSSSSDTNTQGAGRWRLSGHINGSGDLKINKGADAATTGAVSYQIVSCDEQEFSVQTEHISVSTTQTSNTSTIDPVDTSRTFILGSLYMTSSPATSATRAAFFTYELTDENTVTVTRTNHDSEGAEVKPQVITWADWTGVKVYHGTDTLTVSIDTPTAYPHGVSDIDPAYTWLCTSFRHSTSGLEQCSVAAAITDGSNNYDEHNIYYERYDQVAAYSSVASWFLVRFPAQSFEIFHAAIADSGTATTDTLACSGTMYPDGAIFDFTASCNGAGTAFGRPAWRLNAFQTGGSGVLARAGIIRGYGGQASTIRGTFIDIGSFRPSNAAFWLGQIA